MPYPKLRRQHSSKSSRTHLPLPPILQRPFSSAKMFLRSNAILLIFGTATYKINIQDAEAIGLTMAKPIYDLSEAELVTIMRQMNIRQLTIDEEDLATIYPEGQPITVTVKKKTDPIQALRELKRLCDDGFITLTEYDRRKQLILSELGI